MANNVTALPTNLLSRVRKGRLEQPMRILLMGVEGVGKSTFASGAPSPIFITADAGTSHLDIARLPEPQSWGDVLTGLRALEVESHDYKTLVVDSVTWLEPMLVAKVCADNKWSSVEEPGYGKGWVAALDQWRQFVAELERLWTKRQMHIVLLGHTTTKNFKNPEGEDYERYQLAINDKASGMLRQWADAVLFAKHESFTKRDDKTKRVRGISTGARIMHTTWSAAFDAKNRYGLPEELPLSWADLVGAIQTQEQRTATLLGEIEKLTTEIDDAKVKAFVADFTARNKSNADKLAELVNTLSVKADAKRKAEVQS